MVTEFELLNPDDNKKWKVKVDLIKKILILSSNDGSRKWARKIGNNLPVDAFLVKNRVFLTWERPNIGFDRLQEFSIIHAQDLLSGEKLWDWEDYILTVLPYGECVFIITYRDTNNKGYLIKTKARNGQVIWKVTSDSPIISWDINEKRMILKDSVGRVYALNTKTGKVQRKRT